MIPTPQQLEEVAHLSEGRLPAVPFGVLLIASVVHRRTAVLEVRRKQLAKKITFEQGALVDCRSNLVHETLGRYLVSVGKLLEKDLHPYLNLSASRGVPLGEILIERGVLDAEELFKLLQQNLAQKLLDIFTWRDGEFRAHTEPLESASPLKIRVPQLIVTGIIKCSPLEEIESGVVPLVGKRLILHPQPPFSLDEIRLAPRHAAAAQALRTGVRMDELATGTGMPFEEINRLLYALAVLGLVATAEALPRRPSGVMPLPASSRPPDRPDSSFSATRPVPTMPDLPPLTPIERPALPSEQPAVPTAAPPAPAPVSAPVEAVSAERRNEVVQAFLAYRRQDAFDLLGVPESATLAMVEEAYLAFAARYAPWNYPGDDLESIAENARALFLAGARAFDELLDSERRSTLLRRRETLREERRKKPAASAYEIKTDLLDSEAQFKKGCALMEAGRYREAVLQLEFASDCDPQNGPYAAELAYCRFLSSSANSAQALAELRETLRRDPECGIAQLYAGEIERSLGHHDEAEALLRRAIKALAPDRRPIEALKALAADRKRS